MGAFIRVSQPETIKLSSNATKRRSAPQNDKLNANETNHRKTAHEYWNPWDAQSLWTQIDARIDDNGKEMTDAQVRAELQRHLSLGHTALPMCDTAECPDFDYIKGCCPGHGVHYYDDNDNEISKEEYESILQKRK